MIIAAVRAPTLDIRSVWILRRRTPTSGWAPIDLSIIQIDTALTYPSTRITPPLRHVSTLTFTLLMRGVGSLTAIADLIIPLKR